MTVRADASICDRVRDRCDRDPFAADPFGQEKKNRFILFVAIMYFSTDNLTYLVLFRHLSPKSKNNLIDTSR